MILRVLGLLLLFAPPLASAQTPADSSGSDYALLEGGRELRTPTRLVRNGDGQATHLALGDSAVELARVRAFWSSGVYYQTYGVNASRSSVVNVKRYLLQRVERGPLDLYVRADDSPPNPDRDTFDYFSVAGERPREVSVANLRAVLEHHPGSVPHLRRANRSKTFQYATFALGAAVLAYGLVRPAFRDTADFPDGRIPIYEFNLFQPAGLSLMLVSRTHQVAKDRALHEAVRSYQRRDPALGDSE